MTGNGWSRAEMHVLRKLEDLEQNQRETNELVRCIDRKLVGLSVEVRTKSGLWGAVSGFVATLGTLLVGLFVWLVRR